MVLVIAINKGVVGKRKIASYCDCAWPVFARTCVHFDVAQAHFRRRTSYVPYQNTFSLRGCSRQQALPYPETLPCLIEICRKKTDLDTVPLPNNDVLLDTAHERWGV